jgi:5-methylcytosine-specific restriction protein A
MARQTDEWWGKTDDSTPPPSVRRRVMVAAASCCQSCGGRVRFNGQIDHRIAIINGGENRESNLQFLCKPCHGIKTGEDVAEKSTSHRKQLKLGPLKVVKPKRWYDGKIKYNWQTRRYEFVDPGATRDD